ncbi:MAG: xanthine dehydrogenase family protein molybdopterin-binding subunit [Actinobacteria bacterium]|nr:xanthine dehydrogenase family protein molybdopterin-binding subunit [Actinomycetota bacterium]
MSDELNIMESEPLVRDRYVPKEFKLVGKRGVQRRDGKEKAGGKALYTRDVALPGMLYCRLLASPHAHARIVKLDTSKAEKAPGVRAILRYDDPELEGKALEGLETKFNAGHIASDGQAFLHGKFELAVTQEQWMQGGGRVLDGFAWWEGEQCGVAIAADTIRQAEDALALVEVEWEILPHVLDPIESLKPGAPPAIEEINKKNNIIRKVKIEEGDVEKAFKESDQVIEFSIKREPYTAAEPEPMSNVVLWRGDNVEIWAHQQQAYDGKMLFCAKMGIPLNYVKLHIPHQGSQFGHGGNPMMHHTHGLHVISAILSKRTGRPVKTLYDRRDTFYGLSQDAEANTKFKVGFNKDGTITAVKLDTIVAKMGQYGIDHFMDNTRIPNLLLNYLEAQCNIPPAWWMRCEQNHNAFCLSAVFDHVADALEMDPVEVALKNDGVEGRDMAYLAAFKKDHGFQVRDSLAEIVEKGKTAVDWDAKWHAPGKKVLPNGRLHGIGFTWDHEWDDIRGVSCVGLMVNVDGTVDILAQKSDVGCDYMTTHCRIVAEEIGLPIEHVNWRHFEECGFQMMTPDGSCNLCVDAYASIAAARKVRRKILEYAVTPTTLIDIEYPAEFPGYKVEDLEIVDGIVRVKADPSVQCPLSEVVKRATVEQAGTRAPVFDWAWHRQGRYGVQEGRHRLCRQCYFAEVEVDPDTGEVEVTKFVSVNDVGLAVSPESCEGQQYGGAYMGVGRCLGEEVVFDPKTGVKLTGDYIDYKVFTIRDIGKTVNILHESGMGWGAYGLVGIGEDIATVAPGVVGNALHNAIGEWVDEHPVTPARVLAAIDKAREKGIL